MSQPPTAIRQSNIRQAAAAIVAGITLLTSGVTIHSDGWLEHWNVAIATLESAALGCNSYCVFWLYPVENGVPVNDEWIELWIWMGNELSPPEAWVETTNYGSPLYYIDCYLNGRLVSEPSMDP